MRRRLFLLFYIGALHAAIAALLFTNRSIQAILRMVGFNIPNRHATEFYRTMTTLTARVDGTVPVGSILFIGDSLMQGLCVQAVTNMGVNLGIGTDTTEGVLKRMASYKSVREAKAIIMSVGLNDLRWKSDEEILKNYEAIFSTVPAGVPIGVNAILPVDERVQGLVRNQRIVVFNKKLKDHCAGRQACVFIDSVPHLTDLTGNLNGRYHVGDGIHLSTEGYRVWISELGKHTDVMVRSKP